MESIGYIFGIAALIWCVSLSSEVAKLKRMIKECGISNSEKASLRGILGKNIGRLGKIKFESDAEDYEILSKYCLLEDIDEDWLLVKIEKSEIEKLIRIESIKGIQFK
ncbi:hypothetical protein [Clostridium omnivorum]|uniref:Uncharacterized protein n=1 Tax=Clostridium omnivorum TaxID=1604902 RepID=A0ABQ5N656_9CLOT|nr:hypothetical protein [Clostridium sp. E14]GLC30723.1 hypothetical protein bsdE14_21330 [Clostridium sp. E14]